MAKTTRSNKKKVDDSLKDWMKQKTEERNHGRAKCDDWPEAVVEEIKYVLACNDKGTHKITIKDMITRMRDVHKVEATTHDLRHFASNVLKRHSWSTP